MQRQHPPIIVIVDDVKLRSVFRNDCQHLELMRGHIEDRRLTKAQGGASDRHEASRHGGITRGKDGRFHMAGLQAASELKDDALGAAIKPRRNGFERGGEQGHAQSHGGRNCTLHARRSAFWVGDCNFGFAKGAVGLEVHLRRHDLWRDEHHELIVTVGVGTVAEQRTENRNVLKEG